MGLSDYFDVRIKKVVKGQVKVHVQFTEEVLHAIREEAKNFKREIAAIGKAELKDGVWYVVFDRIPKQERHWYLVKVLEFPAGYNAVFHLHPPGVTMFSDTDFEYLNQNYVISVMVDANGVGKVCFRDDEHEVFVLDDFSFQIN